MTTCFVETEQNIIRLGENKLNVYLVIHDYFFDYEMLGIFATKQAAQGFIDKYQPDRYIGIREYYIEEHEVQGLATDNNQQEK